MDRVEYNTGILTQPLSYTLGKQICFLSWLENYSNCKINQYSKQYNI
jgi:hypothetical protein